MHRKHKFQGHKRKTNFHFEGCCNRKRLRITSVTQMNDSVAYHSAVNQLFFMNLIKKYTTL